MLFYNIHFILRTTEDLVRKTVFMVSALEGKKARFVSDLE